MVSLPRPSRLLALFALGAALALPAADDIFMQLPGMKGESTNSTHLDWIMVDGISGCLSTPVGGKTSACEVTISKRADRTSTLATGYLLTGKSFGTNKVLIDICKNTGVSYVCYYKIEMNQVVFTSASTGASTGGDQVSESWSMTFQAIKWTYTYIDAKGGATTPVTQCWDFAANSAVCP